jgi:hypothetical protein
MDWQRQELVADWFYNNYIAAKQFSRCTQDDYDHCMKVALRMINFPMLEEGQKADISGMMSEILFFGLAQTHFANDPMGSIVTPQLTNSTHDQFDKIDIAFHDYEGAIPLGVDVKCKHGSTSRMVYEKIPRVVIQLGGSLISRTENMVWHVVNQPEIKTNELVDLMHHTHLQTGLFDVISHQVERILDFNREPLQEMPLTLEVINSIGEFC